jgi:cytochrome P450
MTTVKLKLNLNLPDQILQEAQRAGLLTEQAIERLIEQAVRLEAGKQLLEAMQRLREANVPPLTEEEIEAEVQAVRAAQRAAGEAGR